MPAHISDTYCTCLYVAAEGLPLWHPGRVDLGDVGYVRDGRFHKLYNVVDGPSLVRSEAARPDLARRTQSGSRSPPGSPGAEQSAWTAVPAFATMGPRNSFSGERRASAPLNVPSSPSSSPRSRRTSLMGAFRSEEEPQPPLPIFVDEAEESAFDIGPRTSANFRSLGAGVGAEVTGTAGGTLSFETSGGDGALLVSRDPTVRNELEHLGTLKAYVKQHRRWISYHYGQSEDMEADELCLVYSTDRTSDWACAVQLGAAQGAKVDFHVFSVGTAGVWGEWRSTLSASQRGPHRDPSQYERARLEAGLGQSGTATPAESAPHEREPTASSRIANWRMSAAVEAGPVNIEASTGSAEAASAQPAQSTAGAGQSVGPSNTAALISEVGRVPAFPDWQWAPGNPFPADQTIVIRRITARSRLGLGFLPMRMAASAGPRRDGPGDRRSSGSTKVPTSTGPLDLLHEWVFHTELRAQISIASDSDVAEAISSSPMRSITATSSPAQLKRAIWSGASCSLRVECDQDGIAVVLPRGEKEGPQVTVLGQHKQNCGSPKPSLGRISPPSSCFLRPPAGVRSPLSESRKFSASLGMAHAVAAEQDA
ncbi:hypothetical protein IE81DRAFT_346737 [Ceraceosorus guamensis]|uniref:Uncharacterized protein n=1 Tax=Ceraceosorus guamensis TaxID=1522189 RepID=A0A316W028_9BASI|nr:hypothetical protein IE81DRAFT_346737 [Ceraceosorus guamensis]PWN43130.1 hypothetical protein IE81DRAFT_346737 [Ceraceosorus guamensis]